MWWAIAAVALGGVAIAVQAPINAALGRGLGAPVPAAAISFAVGFVALFGVSLLQGQGGAYLKLGQVPMWTLAGGLLGAWFVFASVWGVATLGVVTLVAAMVFGQMAAALVIDTTGILGMAVREITLTRVAAAGLVLAGLVLSRF
ncbi:DMT family transporter [Tabrizicola sp.]|uniref:DMT family transporter n=1 Tax=Tabrizicola sp. TaxID=2005166 RepID=UPI0026162F75|nr:DMT family transporter [Tabrizicola sp.]MDM7932500.1 DMT family transporter [Tabrizicola sp.]